MVSWQACSLVSLQGTVVRLLRVSLWASRLLYDLLFQSGVQASLMGEGTQRRPRCNVGHTTIILEQERGLIRDSGREKERRDDVPGWISPLMHFTITCRI